MRYRQLQFSAPPGATVIYLVRHGESAAVDPEVPQPMVDGQGDPELAPLGRLQAERVGERLADEGIEAIYCSTLRRTAETAAPLAARLSLTPVVDRDLREVHLGEWEGGAFRQKVLERDPVAVRMIEQERWDVAPGGEANEDVNKRIEAAFTRIAAAHPDQKVVAVAHAGLIGMAVSLATGARPFAFTTADNAGISVLVLAGDRWIVRSFNDTSHLAGLVDPDA